MKPHKWAKEIKAWADGVEIECRRKESWGWREWETFKEFYWYNDNEIYEYRIKPQPKEPQYLYVWGKGMGFEFTICELKDRTLIGKIKLEQDDETI